MQMNPEQLATGNQQLAAGIALFNAREFWHAHEAWEVLWLAAAGEEKQFLQGLIQLAAAYHHVKRGTSPRGAVRLFDAALGRLSAFPEGHLGVDRAAVVARAAEHRRRIAEGGHIGDEDYPEFRYN